MDKEQRHAELQVRRHSGPILPVGELQSDHHLVLHTKERAELRRPHARHQAAAPLEDLELLAPERDKVDIEVDFQPLFLVGVREADFPVFPLVILGRVVGERERGGEARIVLCIRIDRDKADVVHRFQRVGIEKRFGFRLLGRERE